MNRLIKATSINTYLNLRNPAEKDGKGGLSVSMTRDIIKALRAIAKFAQLEYGLKNICDGITVPKIKSPKQKRFQTGNVKGLKSTLLIIYAYATSAYCCVCIQV